MAKLEKDTSVQCSSFYFVLPATYSHCIIASKLCLMGCMLMFLKDNLLADINNILKDWNAFQIWPNWNSLIRRLTPLHRLWLRDYYMLRVQCIINKAKITLTGSTENKYNCNSLWKTLEVIGRKEPLQHASKYDDDDEMMMLALQNVFELQYGLANMFTYFHPNFTKTITYLQFLIWSFCLSLSSWNLHHLNMK